MFIIDLHESLCPGWHRPMFEIEPPEKADPARRRLRFAARQQGRIWEGI
jgi:hypothetical protein